MDQHSRIEKKGPNSVVLRESCDCTANSGREARRRDWNREWAMFVLSGPCLNLQLISCSIRLYLPTVCVLSSLTQCFSLLALVHYLTSVDETQFPNLGFLRSRLRRHPGGSDQEIV